MERQPCGTNGVSKIRSFHYRPTKKLGGSYKVYGGSTRNNEEAGQKETKEFSRIEGWRQYVVGKQKHPFEQTLKEAGPGKIWTFYNLKGHWFKSVLA